MEIASGLVNYSTLLIFIVVLSIFGVFFIFRVDSKFTQLYLFHIYSTWNTEECLINNG